MITQFLKLNNETETENGYKLLGRVKKTNFVLISIYLLHLSKFTQTFNAWIVKKYIVKIYKKIYILKTNSCIF